MKGEGFRKKPSTFREYKEEHVQIARDLGYGRNVIRKILMATSENEITAILHQARMDS